MTDFTKDLVIGDKVLFQGYPEIQFTSLGGLGLDLSGTSLADTTFIGNELDGTGSPTVYSELNIISNYLGGGNVSFKSSPSAIPYVHGVVIANQTFGNKQVLVVEVNPSWMTHHAAQYFSGGTVY